MAKKKNKEAVKPEVALDQYIRARYPIIMVQSHEEDRVLSAIKEMLDKTWKKNKERERKLVTWSITEGLVAIEMEDREKVTLEIAPEESADPTQALNALTKFSEDDPPTLFVFRDLHYALQDAVAVRLLRDIAHAFQTTRHSLILLSASWSNETVPDDLAKSIVILDWPLPTYDELELVFDEFRKAIEGEVPYGLNGERVEVIRALQGLTVFEAESALMSAVITTEAFNKDILPEIVRHKEQIIRQSGLLEFYPETVTMEKDVGGLEGLKEYAAIKRAAFSKEAQDYGVDSPKGVLMVGIPGSGKSLSAKAIAGGHMPVLRMDVGSLFGSLLGQSESQVEAALKVAEAVAPCVLWIDEIEKALGGNVGGSETDGGTSSRVFGIILTWMQETTAPVYIVATANDVRSLRPELLRRFDDLVWVDLPNQEARVEIFNIHIKKRGHSLPPAEVKKAAKKTWAFTGAEIEKVVKSALETAFHEGGEFTGKHLIKAAKKIVPIYDTMGDKIEMIREWCASRAVVAGAPLEPKPRGSARKQISPEAHSFEFTSDKS